MASLIPRRCEIGTRLRNTESETGGTAIEKQLSWTVLALRSMAKGSLCGAYSFSNTRVGACGSVVEAVWDVGKPPL